MNENNEQSQGAHSRSRSTQEKRSRNLFFVVVLTALVVVASQAKFTPESAFMILSRGDNDDIMRFLSVRAWLAGQSWFDMTQYRVLAPEGLNLHWSRYVDAGIGFLRVIATPWMPVMAAEAFAIVVWPLLLFSVLIVWTANVLRRSFGDGAAIFAILFLMLWPVFLDNYFKVTRVDHHNVQILLLTILIGTLATQMPSRTAGIAAGAVAALSLAVGLEMALAIGLAGVILGLRTIRDPKEDGAQLVSFLVTLAALSALLFVGQTPRTEWAIPYCDELSSPFLAVLAAGAVIGWVFRTAVLRFDSQIARFAVLAICAALTAAAAIWLLGDCAKGPYGSLPLEIQDIITTFIVEAVPIGPGLIAGDPAAYMNVVPIVSAILLGGGLLVMRRGVESRTLGVFLAFALLGLLGMFSQKRFVVVAAGAVPALVGIGLSTLLASVLMGRNRLIAGTLFVLGLLSTVLFPQVQAAYAGFAAPKTGSSEPRDRWAQDCRSRDHLSEFSRLPAGVVLTPDPIGSSLLLVSDHTIISAPYHRSVKAMGSIHLPYSYAEAEFREFVTSSDVDYVIMCKLLEQGPILSFARDLAAGVEAPGFRRLALPDDTPLIGYEVTD